MEDFTEGILNETLERHSFNNRKQEEEEKFNDLLTESKLLSKSYKDVVGVGLAYMHYISYNF